MADAGRARLVGSGRPFVACAGHSSRSVALPIVVGGRVARPKTGGRWRLEHLDWHRRETSVRLRAGLDLFDGGSEGWLLQGLDGAYTRVQVPSDLMVQAAPVLWGARAPAEALASASAHEDLAELLERFAAAGYLQMGAVDASAGRPARVLLLGTGAIATACAALLSDVELTVERDLAWLKRSTPSVSEILRRHDALVACATHLPDALWLRLDALCQEHALAWQRCHIEGSRALVGPCSLPGRAPGYADARARRLAADASPRARLAHWRALDVAPGARAYEPSTPAAAFVAALLATDVRALLRGAQPPGAQRLTCVALETLATTHHRVLPVPAGLMCAPVP